MRANVYIDGFNLYNGAVKGTSHKWLDVAQMSRLLLPRYHIGRIRYFTAHISPRPGNPDGPIRQQVYLRALATIPNLSIHLGQFTTHRRRMMRADSTLASPVFVDVLRTDEKGSDVNLATYLVHDAYQQEYDCAVVVSNDSDLLEPIRVVKEVLGRRVGLINPHPHPSRQLRAFATFYKPIRSGVLAASQFPPLLSDQHGVITKPASW
ncbi:MAG: NYN domain-containing protein [Phycisphaerales bacterium]|nr:NYN domain-containing protein [Phycisphaerales bacterium]